MENLILKTLRIVYPMHRWNKIVMKTIIQREVVMLSIHTSSDSLHHSLLLYRFFFLITLAVCSYGMHLLTNTLHYITYISCRVCDLKTQPAVLWQWGWQSLQTGISTPCGCVLYAIYKKQGKGAKLEEMPETPPFVVCLINCGLKMVEP